MVRFRGLFNTTTATTTKHPRLLWKIVPQFAIEIFLEYLIFVLDTTSRASHNSSSIHTNTARNGPNGSPLSLLYIFKFCHRTGEEDPGKKARFLILETLSILFLSISIHRHARIQRGQRTEKPAGVKFINIGQWTGLRVWTIETHPYSLQIFNPHLWLVGWYLFCIPVFNSLRILSPIDWIRWRNTLCFNDIHFYLFWLTILKLNIFNTKNNF